MCSLHIQTPTRVLHEETRNTRAAEEQVCDGGGDEIFVSRQTQTIVKSPSCPWLDFKLTNDKPVNTVRASSWQRDAGDISRGHPGLSQQLQLPSKAPIQEPPGSVAGCALNVKGSRFCCWESCRFPSVAPFSQSSQAPAAHINPASTKSCWRVSARSQARGSETGLFCTVFAS